MRILFRTAYLKTILLSFLLTASSVSAQNLTEYLGLVKKGSLLLNQADNQIRAAKQDVLLAKAALLPSVGADFSYQRDFTKSFLFINDEETAALFGDRFRTNFNNNLNLDMVASQPLYDPSARATHQLALLTAELSEYSFDELSQELLSQGVQLFWQAIFARESLKVLAENQALAQAQWQQVNTLFDECYTVRSASRFPSTPAVLLRLKFKRILSTKKPLNWKSSKKNWS